MTKTAFVDVGQTGTRIWASGSDSADERTCAGYAPADSPEVATASAVIHAVDLLAQRGKHVSTLAIGATGFRGARPRSEVLARMLAPKLSLERLVVADDSVTAYLGGVGPRPGVAVVAGTGAVALACDGHGRFAHVDGFGALLGDSGGGFWLGRRGLQMALCDLEGRMGGSRAVLNRLREHLGCTDLRGLVRTWSLEASTVQHVAAIAPSICELAREGNPDGVSLVQDAGWQLADSAVAALIGASVPAPDVVVVVGGLARSEELVDAFSRAIRDRLGAETATHAGPTDAVHLGTERILEDGVDEIFPDLVDSWTPRA